MPVPEVSSEPRLEIVDGLRVVWAYSPGPRSHAGLVFRVGQADETLTSRGITHLLEHLALAGTDVSVDHNGQTDLLTTTFTVSGTLDEIDAHLARLTANLAALPTARLEVEKQILRAEEEGRGQGIFERLALYRYGASGIGLVGYPEWGLERVDDAALAQWAARYFGADNAVLVVVGPQAPTHLSWQLPAGIAHPAPEPTQVPVRLPTFAFEPVAGPGLMVELPRGTAEAAFAGVLDRELMRSVRGERGLAYRASAGFLPVSNDRVVVVAQTDSVADREQETVDAFLDVIFGLAADGPDPRLLADVVNARATLLEAPEAVYGRAHNGACDLLFGRPLSDRSEILDSYTALTVEQVREVAAEVARAATVLLPRQARALGRGGFTRLGAVDTEPVSGHRVTLPTEPDEVPMELIVGVEGVSRRRGDQAETIRYRDLAVLLRHPDGRRLLIAASGDTIGLDPSVVDHARIDLVDVAAGPDRWLDLPGSPTPAQPAAQPAAAVPIAESAQTTEEPAPKPRKKVKDVTPIAPLTRFQRFVVRPLRWLAVAVVVLFLFGLVWPTTPDDTFVPPGDVLLFLVPLAVATVDNLLYARRARRRNEAEAAHQARQAQPTAADPDAPGGTEEIGDHA